MTNKSKELLLKYGVPTLAVVVIAIHLILVNSKSLSKWKGGGYGMYTEIHYFHNQIYIPGMSVDSLLKDDSEMKITLGYLMLMPNKNKLTDAAELILERTDKESIHVQIWKPDVNPKKGVYTRVLIDEVYIKKIDL